MTTKTCTQCGEEKELAYFHIRKDTASGRRSNCKSCHTKRTVEFNSRNREQHRAASYNYVLRTKYGLTREEYDSMLSSQDHRCLICRTDTPGGSGWHVDHCHATNVVRGILCHHCNCMLGHARDSTSNLQAAIDYLNRSTQQ